MIDYKICNHCWKEYQRKPTFSRKWFETSLYCSRSCSDKKIITQETRIKMREWHFWKVYKPMSEEWKTNISIAQTGKKQSQETVMKRKISNAWFKHSNKTKQKISELRKWEWNGMYWKIPHNWKWQDVWYYALHSWVARKLWRPCECSHCWLTNLRWYKIHWANLSHNYLRDLTDWKRLCAKCHWAYDSNKLILK